MQYEFGFIGCGNMGGALARAAVKTLCPERVILSNRTASKAQSLAAELGTKWGSNADAAENARYLFLGVKPQMMEDMLTSVAPILCARRDRFVLVTMAAGLTIARIREMAGGAHPVIRIMPNTPVGVGAGMIQYAASDNVTEEEIDFFVKALSHAGRLDPLPEHLIDAASAVSGCGPAFADLFIEALADGGVQCGLTRRQAQLYAAQMLMGSAKLLLESGKHPGELKDAVCSPGGSTIVGVHALESHGFRAAVMDAVAAAFEKNRALGKS